MKVLKVILFSGAAAGVLSLAACDSSPEPMPVPAPPPMDGGVYMPSK